MTESIADSPAEIKKYPLDLMLVFILSILSLLGAMALEEGNVLRIILSIPIIVFLPGYSLVSLLWPEKRDEETAQDKSSESFTSFRFGIGDLERLVLSLGLSIAIVSIVGLILNFTASGISKESSLFGIFVITMIFTILAYYRRQLLPDSERYHVNFQLLSYKLPEDGVEKAMVGVIAISLILSCFLLAWVISMPTAEGEYSTFYLLDANSTTENYPVNITTNDTVSVIVGVECIEYRETQYAIVAGMDNTTAIEYQDTWNQTFSLINSPQIGRNLVLEHGETFEETFTFRVNRPGRYRITWQLYIDGVPSEYSVHLWVNVFDTR